MLPFSPSPALTSSEAATRRTAKQEDSLGSRQLAPAVPPVERFISVLQSLWAVKTFSARSGVSKRLMLVRSACLEEGISLSLQSVEQFVQFITSHPFLSQPRLAVTPDGNLRASWDSSQRSALRFRVFGGGEIARFVLFAPRPGGRTAHIAGTDDLTTIVAHARGLGADWLKRQ